MDLAGGALAAVIAGAAAVAAYYGVRARSWAVMTDELQVVRLAESIAERLSPVPYIHDVYYGALSQLYPLVLAPIVGVLPAATAVPAAHALNAVLLPSAAVPAFLLARSITGSRTAAALAAVLTAVTPWLVLTSTLLTENAAYPAFVWSLFLCHRALVVPSAGRDVAAVAGLLLAFFARTQLLVLAAVFPLAVVVHQAGFARARGSSVRRALLGVPRVHPVLTAVYAAGLLLAGALAAAGKLGALVGNYAVPFEGDLLPPGVWRAAASHLDQIAIGCGVVPVLLAAAWAGAALVRPSTRQAHAYAVLLSLLVPIMTLQVASFDLRFTPERFLQGRYLFYLAPVFAVGAAAALAQRTAFRLRAAMLGLAAGVLAWLLQLAAHDDKPIIFWASPAAAFHPVLEDAAAHIWLSAETFATIAGTALAAGALALSRQRPQAAALVAGTLLAAFGAGQAVYVFERFADPVMTRPPRLGELPRDWIDRAVPDGASVALVPSPHDGPPFWWEAELWNKQADRVLRVDGGPTFSPFPADDVSIDFVSGILRGPQPTEFLVVSPSERRFHMLEAARLVYDKTLTLVRVERPYRLDWATRGLTSDGWTSVGRPATLRFYWHGSSSANIAVEVVLSSSSRAARPVDFRLRAGGVERSGWVDPGGARPPLRLSVCVAAGGFVDATLRTQASVRIPDGRLVGVHVDRIDVEPAGPCESA